MDENPVIIINTTTQLIFAPSLLRLQLRVQIIRLKNLSKKTTGAQLLRLRTDFYDGFYATADTAIEIKKGRYSRTRRPGGSTGSRTG